MSSSGDMGPPAATTRPDLYEGLLWDIDMFEHPSDRYGRFKNTREFRNANNLYPSAWITGPKRHNAKRNKSDVSGHIAKLAEDQRGGKLPEYDDYWTTQLSTDLKEAGGVIRNVVAMDLGSLCYSEEPVFHKNARAYLFVLNVLKVISDAANESKKSTGKDTLWGPNSNLIFEDVYYGKEDIAYLDEKSLNTGFLGTFEDKEGWLRDERVKPITSMSGKIGWRGTHGNNRDYIFITFKPISPIRQMLAKYLFTAGSLQDPSGKERKPVLPRAIICRDASVGYNDDERERQVEAWFKRNYNKVHQFLEHEDDKPFEGDIWLYTLKSEVQGNAPSAQNVQGSA